MKIRSLAALALAAAALAPAAASAQVSTARVTGGTVQGTAVDGVGVFKGIPFAAPPIGDLRWAPPAPVRPWSGVKQATAYAPGCMQDTAMMRSLGDDITASEDCLYLNVWTPAHSANEKLPVMVWIYGGAFVAGSTGAGLYDGMKLAQHGVILVSVAYRLGSFGWLAHPDLSKQQGGHSGDYGLMDQIAGLKWVKANIARFGGDPNNVTVFGESAGGISVGMLAVSPLARGLYNKAISESGGNFALPRADTGPGQGTRTLASSEAMGVKAFELLGARTLADARAVPADVVLKKLAQAGVGWPTYDGYVLPDDPWLLYSRGKFNDTPVLIGTNSDEGTLFVRGPVQPDTFEANIRKQYGAFADRVLAAYPHATPEEARQAQADMMREQAFAWPTYSWARMQSSKGKGQVYIYYFDHKTPQSPGGSLHASEMQYVFGNPQRRGQVETPADDKMTSEFMGYWTNFAKTGDPNGPGLPAWPRFTAANSQYMALGDSVGPIAVPHLAQYQLWDDYYASERAKGAEK